MPVEASPESLLPLTYKMILSDKDRETVYQCIEIWRSDRRAWEHERNAGDALAAMLDEKIDEIEKLKNQNLLLERTVHVYEMAARLSE